MLTVALFALSGILFGGAWSLYRQRAPRVAIGVTVLLAALALLAGLAWLFPGRH